jgi:hypothetical protein
MSWPKRIRRGTGGPTYFFDGVGAGTIIPGNSGINATMDDLGEPAPDVLPAGDFDNLQAYFQGRDIARAEQIASYVNA